MSNINDSPPMDDLQQEIYDWIAAHPGRTVEDVPWDEKFNTYPLTDVLNAATWLFWNLYIEIDTTTLAMTAREIPKEQGI